MIKTSAEAGASADSFFDINSFGILDIFAVGKFDMPFGLDMFCIAKREGGQYDDRF